MMEFGCQVKASRLLLQDWNISEIISHLCQGCTLWSGMAAMRIQCSLFPLKKRTPYSAMESNWQFPVVPLFSIRISSSCGPTTFWSRAQQSSSTKSRFFYTSSSSGRISLEGCLFAYWSLSCPFFLSLKFVSIHLCTLNFIMQPPTTTMQGIHNLSICSRYLG